MSDAVFKSSQTGYIVRLVYFAVGLLVAVHLFGTVGYMVLTEGKYSWFDCFYMTFITVATIGFGEIIDMSSNQPARILTVVIGILGAGNLSLLFSVVTVALLETDLNGTLRRKRMEKTIKKLKKHYIPGLPHSNIIMVSVQETACVIHHPKPLSSVSIEGWI